MINHFKSHIKRKNNEWMTYDDLQISQMKTKETEEILQYLLFYSKIGIDTPADSTFQDKLQLYFHGNWLTKPLIRHVTINITQFILIIDDFLLQLSMNNVNMMNLVELPMVVLKSSLK